MLADCFHVSSRRANCIQQLSMWDHVRTRTMPAVVMAMVLGSQCSSLQGLFIIATDVGLAGVEIAVLAAMTRLTYLEVSCGPNARIAQVPSGSCV